MGQLIQELRSEHLEIIRLMEAVKLFGPSSSEGKQKLMAAKEKLLAHLRKEDVLLYPTLLKAASRKKRLREVVELFVNDMEGVTSQAMKFFRDYEMGDSNGELKWNFEELVAVLVQRITREDLVLYHEYEKLMENLTPERPGPSQPVV